jgi:hypothetical protein
MGHQGRSRPSPLADVIANIIDDEALLHDDGLKEAKVEQWTS